MPQHSRTAPLAAIALALVACAILAGCDGGFRRPTIAPDPTIDIIWPPHAMGNVVPVGSSVTAKLDEQARWSIEYPGESSAEATCQHTFFGDLNSIVIDLTESNVSSCFDPPTADVRQTLPLSVCISASYPKNTTEASPSVTVTRCFEVGEASPLSVAISVPFGIMDNDKTQIKLERVDDPMRTPVSEMTIMGAEGIFEPLLYGTYNLVAIQWPRATNEEDLGGAQFSLGKDGPQVIRTSTFDRIKVRIIDGGVLEISQASTPTVTPTPSATPTATFTPTPVTAPTASSTPPPPTTLAITTSIPSATPTETAYPTLTPSTTTTFAPVPSATAIATPTLAPSALTITITITGLPKYEIECSTLIFVGAADGEPRRLPLVGLPLKGYQDRAAFEVVYAGPKADYLRFEGSPDGKCPWNKFNLLCPDANAIPIVGETPIVLVFESNRSSEHDDDEIPTPVP